MTGKIVRATPQAVFPASQATGLRTARARRLHRWIATIFMASVAANFAAMPWGQPPLWITYAPLLPLLLLMITGLVMFAAPWLARVAGSPAAHKGGRLRSD